MLSWEAAVDVVVRMVDAEAVQNLALVVDSLEEPGSHDYVSEEVFELVKESEDVGDLFEVLVVPHEFVSEVDDDSEEVVWAVELEVFEEALDVGWGGDDEAVFDYQLEVFVVCELFDAEAILF